ncbi:MAG: acetate kinase [Bradyrhizobiaceae bacterium PARB1]|jgi:acetate kinase|nr:MAG: acetate kinase [Bradyrhizobiaceae bacterium PARB1]
MAPTTLVLNAGSSSIKFALYRAGDDVSLALRYKGKLDHHAGDVHFRITDAAGRELTAPDAHGHADDPTSALLERLEPLLGDDDIVEVGHRVVHGGPDFVEPVQVDDAILRRLDALSPLAPLHQQIGLAAIRTIMRTRPALRQIACFDTAFHHDMPPVYRNFALPDLGADIRRYGFHGLSFAYIASRLDAHQRRTVVAHLGSGASVCALLDGRSINTSMSFTPLDGLMMATRSGAIDPALVLYLQRTREMCIEAVENLLYHRSGLLGVSGSSADMRTLIGERNAGARQAVAQFCARAAEHMASMMTALRGCDAIVFTGGIGENSPEIRASICDHLAWLGLRLDPVLNASGAGVITCDRSEIVARVIETNEELVIAREVRRLTQSRH